MDVSSIIGQPEPSTAAGGSRSLAGLESEDFFKLLIAQLANQDPLEPAGNEELLRQISSIREIELSSTLTESLRSLTGQRQFGAVSALIGQYVSGPTRADGTIESGIVVGVRFEADGRPMLELSSGAELPFDQVGAIQSPIRAGEALIGKTIVGVDNRDRSKPEMVEGVVTAVRVGTNSEIMLELDTGEDLRLRDFVGLASQAA